MRAHSLDVRAYEVAPVARVLEELCPRVAELVEAARVRLGLLLAACDGTDTTARVDSRTGLRDSYLPFERAVDARLAKDLGTRKAVEEIAFMAQLEVRQRGERLQRAVSLRALTPLLDECDSALRRIRKGVGAADAAIAAAEGVERTIDFSSELQTSLKVRRAYARLRREFERHAQTLPLKNRFRAIGTQLAVFVGWDVYIDLRVHDRLVLREMQQRILSWLREDTGNKSSQIEGGRLWQDLLGCSQMLTQISRRQELVEHDRALLARLAQAVEARPLEPLGPPALQWLQALEGLDSDLDRLAGEAAPVDRLQPCLRRLAIQFDVPHFGREATTRT